MISTVWVSAFMIGLLGSTHCIGMCGGIASAFSTQTVSVAGQSSLYFPLLYNLGRASSYGLAGALAGATGLSIGELIHIEMWSQILRLITGLMILSIGLALLYRMHSVQRLEPLGKPIWQLLAPLTKCIGIPRTGKQIFAMGLLWGWLPCGMVYSALIIALGAGSAVNGAITMLCFALGTLPALLLSSTVVSNIKTKINPLYIRHTTGILLLILGLWTMVVPIMQPEDHSSHQHHHHSFQF